MRAHCVMMGGTCRKLSGTSQQSFYVHKATLTLVNEQSSRKTSGLEGFASVNRTDCWSNWSQTFKLFPGMRISFVRCAPCHAALNSAGTSFHACFTTCFSSYSWIEFIKSVRWSCWNMKPQKLSCTLFTAVAVGAWIAAFVMNGAAQTHRGWLAGPW